LSGWNANTIEFEPLFGSGFLFAPTVPQTGVPKISPSTPVVARNTTEDEKKQTESVIKNNELNIQQVKELLRTAREGEYDDLPNEDNES